MDVTSYSELVRCCDQVRRSQIARRWSSNEHSGRTAKGGIYMHPCFTADVMVPSGKPLRVMEVTALSDGRHQCYMVKQELGLFESKVPHKECDKFLWRRNVDTNVFFEEHALTMAQRIVMVGGFREVALNLSRDHTGRRTILPLVRPEDVSTPPHAVMPSIMCWTFRLDPDAFVITQLQRAIDLGNLETNFLLMMGIAEEVQKWLDSSAKDKVRLLIMSPYGYQVK